MLTWKISGTQGTGSGSELKHPCFLVSIHSNFIWSDVVRVIFVRQSVHLTTYSFIATQFNHILAELSITDEPVVTTQEISLLAFHVERTRDEVLVIPWLLPLTVPVGSPFHDVVIRNREEIHGVLDKFLILPSLPLRKKCPHVQ